MLVRLLTSVAFLSTLNIRQGAFADDHHYGSEENGYVDHHYGDGGSPSHDPYYGSDPSSEQDQVIGVLFSLNDTYHSCHSLEPLRRCFCSAKSLDGLP